mgnify:CR=1 FL=1
MLISKAYAQSVETAVDIGAAVPSAAAAAPTPMEAFIWNMGLVLVLVVLFYMLLIRPQQKRFREHSQMLDGLKKGDRVVTGGGLVGKIDKITDGGAEVIVDLGGGLKVTAMRSSLQNSALTTTKTAAASNDAKASDAKATKKK